MSGIVTATSGAPLNIQLVAAKHGQLRPQYFEPTRHSWDNEESSYAPRVVRYLSGQSMPAAGTWGNEPHNAVRGPGRDNWNISLFKNFLFNEQRGTNLQFRAEFFNVGTTLNGSVTH